MIGFLFTIYVSDCKLVISELIPEIQQALYHEHIFLLFDADIAAVFPCYPPYGFHSDPMIFLIRLSGEELSPAVPEQTPVKAVRHLKIKSRLTGSDFQTNFSPVSWKPHAGLDRIVKQISHKRIDISVTDQNSAAPA